MWICVVGGGVFSSSGHIEMRESAIGFHNSTKSLNIYIVKLKKNKLSCLRSKPFYVFRISYTDSQYTAQYTFVFMYIQENNSE